MSGSAHFSDDDRGPMYIVLMVVLDILLYLVPFG